MYVLRGGKWQQHRGYCPEKALQLSTLSLADVVMKVGEYLCHVDLIETFSVFQTEEFSKSENKTHCL